jgi:hypothetical protein
LSETTIVPFQVSRPGRPTVIGMVWVGAPSLATVISWAFKSIIGASATDAEWLYGRLKVGDTITLN